MGDVVAVREVESSIGRLRLAVTPKGVVRLALPREGGKGFRGWLARALPDAETVDWLPELDKVRDELERYFAGSLQKFTVPLDLRGTPFQLDVWHAVCEVGLGETRTYTQIAARIERPRAVRAVGTANGANPVPLIVPCHRIITAAGGLGGYGGGIETKRKLLAFERATLPRGALL